MTESRRYALALGLLFLGSFKPCDLDTCFIYSNKNPYFRWALKYKLIFMRVYTYTYTHTFAHTLTHVIHIFLHLNQVKCLLSGLIYAYRCNAFYARSVFFRNSFT